jgi:membrane protein DedA with SNARE-associated domain
VALTAIGSAVWCFGFAAGGWALGGRWKEFHDAFRYADYVGIALVFALLALFAMHLLRSRATGREVRKDVEHFSERA